jgi:hypothetical protein
MVSATSEQIRWQRQAATLLGKLLELAAKRDLPVLGWTVSYAGCALLGSFYPAESPDRRRGDFAAWKAAITAASGQDPAIDSEHEFGTEIRLVAQWKWLPVGLAPAEGPRPGVNVVLAASIWADEDGEDSNG